MDNVRFLTEDEVVVENVPDLADVRTMLGILDGLGGETTALEEGRIACRMRSIRCRWTTRHCCR